MGSWACDGENAGGDDRTRGNGDATPSGVVEAYARLMESERELESKRAAMEAAFVRDRYRAWAEWMGSILNPELGHHLAARCRFETLPPDRLEALVRERRASPEGSSAPVTAARIEEESRVLVRLVVLPGRGTASVEAAVRGSELVRATLEQGFRVLLLDLCRLAFRPTPGRDGSAPSAFDPFYAPLFDAFLGPACRLDALWFFLGRLPPERFPEVDELAWASVSSDPSTSAALFAADDRTRYALLRFERRGLDARTIDAIAAIPCVSRRLAPLFA